METAPKNNAQEGKPDPSLLPMDVLVEFVLPAYAEGVAKYRRESWRKGFHASTMIAACLRHITAFFWDGEDIDPDSAVGKHHLGGAVFCLLSILWSLKSRPELDDRPNRDFTPKRDWLDEDEAASATIDLYDYLDSYKPAKPVTPDQWEDIWRKRKQAGGLNAPDKRKEE